MASYIKNLLKQLPFYGKTIKSRIKKFTNAKLLSELPFFEKPKKAKIKQLTIKKLLQEQSFYKQRMSKMSYSESKSEPDFSNSLSTFAPIFSESKSESDSESNFNSVFINLGICIFFILYLHSSK